MANREKMERLIDMLESDQPIGHDDVFYAFCNGDERIEPIYLNVVPASEGSLDSAKMLQEKLLEKWRWWVSDGLYWAKVEKEVPCVTLVKGTPGVDLMVVNGHNETNPARAWLVAIIRAMIEEMK